MDFSTQFRYGEFSAWGIFGTWTFQHMDILIPCKAKWTFQLRHFGTCATVLKCPCAQISPCQKVLMPESPHVEMIICQNICSVKWCTCQNDPMLKHPCRLDSFRNVPCQNGLSALVQLVLDSQLRWHYLRTKSDVEAGVLGCSGISSSFSCK